MRHTTESESSRRPLGAAQLVFFVVAATAPLGFALGAGPLLIGRGGIAAPAAILVVAGILAVFAVGYILMAKTVDASGGLYAFVEAGLGTVAGSGAAAVALLTYAAATIGAVGALAAFANAFTAEALGFTIEWWIWALAAVGVVGVLGSRRIEWSGRVLGVVIAAEFLVLTGFAAAIVAQGGAAGLTLEPFTPRAFSASNIGVMLAVSLVAFAGFEATVVYSEEVRDRVRSIRRATFGVLALLAGVFALVFWSIIVAYGVDVAVQAAVADPVGYFFAAADRYVGAWAVDLLSGMAVFSWFASVLAFHNATARYLAATGSQRITPRIFGQHSPVTGAPRNASWALTALSLVIVVVFAATRKDPYLDLYVLVSTPAVIGVPALETLASLAIVVYFLRHRPLAAPWSRVIAPSMSVVALGALTTLLLLQLDLLTAQGLGFNLAVGLVVLAVFVAGALRGAVLKRRHASTRD